jgi:hypothetical protein
MHFIRTKQLAVDWAIQYARDAIKGEACQEPDAEVPVGAGVLLLTKAIRCRCTNHPSV